MEPFKEKINSQTMSELAFFLAWVFPQFPRSKFIKNLAVDLEPLELKQRVQFVSRRIETLLPESPETLQKISKVGDYNSQFKKKLGGFTIWPLTDYLANVGPHFFLIGLEALREITPHFTSEFAIRNFLAKDFDLSICQIEKWTSDSNEHVRRLCSEGLRPKLPWGTTVREINENPRRIWTVLKKLTQDPSEYVLKSVANHLNDWSKIDPNFVLKKVTSLKSKKWQKHALRSLIKQGNPKALELIGVKPKTVKLISQTLPNKKIEFGKKVIVSAKIKNIKNDDIECVVDLVIGFLKKNGKLSKKVFKGKKLKLSPFKVHDLSLNFQFKKITTRVYYPGQHSIALKINGIETPSLDFWLLDESRAHRS